MKGAADRVRIVGGRGMLGTDLAAACAGRGIACEVFDLPDWDITNPADRNRILDGARAVVNCAAYTNVEQAEAEEARAFQVNAEAAGELAALARARGAWLLQISTDYVFDGTCARPYVESDAPGAINAYGRTKQEGERRVLQHHDRACVLRIAWTYGAHGDNFVKKICRSLQTQPRVPVVSDQIGAPTATCDVAAAICDLLAAQPAGILHFANEGYASRFEVAQFIARQLRSAAEVVPCATRDFPSAARRPRNSRFDCARIRPLLTQPIPSWQASLAGFLQSAGAQRV